MTRCGKAFHDSVGEQVSSLLTFGRDLARKSSPLTPNTTSWLRKRVAELHRFHPTYTLQLSEDGGCLVDLDSNMRREFKAT